MISNGAVILCMYGEHTPELDTNVYCLHEQVCYCGLITAKADVSHLVQVDFLHLSMRHIMWLWQALIGSWFEVVLGCICMNVCNGFTVEVYDFCHM